MPGAEYLLVTRLVDADQVGARKVKGLVAYALAGSNAFNVGAESIAYRAFLVNEIKIVSYVSSGLLD